MFGGIRQRETQNVCLRCMLYFWGKFCIFSTKHLKWCQTLGIWHRLLSFFCCCSPSYSGGGQAEETTTQIKYCTQILLTVTLVYKKREKLIKLIFNILTQRRQLLVTAIRVTTPGLAGLCVANRSGIMLLAPTSFHYLERPKNTHSSRLKCITHTPFTHPWYDTGLWYRSMVKRGKKYMQVNSSGYIALFAPVS